MNHAEPTPPRAVPTTTFRDTQQRSWDLRLDVAAVRRVKAATGVDLLRIAETEHLAPLMNDPMTLADVLWVIVQPAAATLGVSDEQFGGALGGETIESATLALLEAITGFFRPGQREVLRKALAKMRTAEEHAMAEAADRIERMSVEELLAAAPGTPSTSSPGSSASTPDR